MNIRHIAALFALSTVATLGFAQSPSNPQSTGSQTGSSMNNSTGTTSSANTMRSSRHNHRRTKGQDGNNLTNGRALDNGTLPGSNGGLPGNSTSNGSLQPNNGVPPNTTPLPGPGTAPRTTPQMNQPGTTPQP